MAFVMKLKICLFGTQFAAHILFTTILNSHCASACKTSATYMSAKTQIPDC